MWPDLGEVKDIPPEFLGVGWGEDLNIACPRWVLASLDGVEEILGMPVWVFSRHSDRLIISEVFDTLVGLEMNLDIVEAAVGFNPLVRVARVTVHVAVRIRRATVRK